MCYQEIEKFHRRTSNETFLRIFNKYFAKKAPFPVNLPERIILEIRSKEAALAKMDLANLQSVFDAARHELLNLMEADTYQRFLRSPLFVSYCKGEKLHAPDTTSRDHSHGGSTNVESEVYSSEDHTSSDMGASMQQSQTSAIHKPSDPSRIYVFTNHRESQSLGMVSPNSPDPSDGAGSGDGRGRQSLEESSRPEIDVELSRATPTSLSSHPTVPSPTIPSNDRERDSTSLSGPQPTTSPLPRIVENPVQPGKTDPEITDEVEFYAL